MANSTVNRAATERGALSRGALAILGVFGPKNDMRALVRLPGGRIKQVEPGARLDGGMVAAIDAEGVVIQKNGKARRLELLN